MIYRQSRWRKEVELVWRYVNTDVTARETEQADRLWATVKTDWHFGSTRGYSYPSADLGAMAGTAEMGHIVCQFLPTSLISSHKWFIRRKVSDIYLDHIISGYS